MPWKIKVEEPKVERIQQSRGYRDAQREGYLPLPVMNGDRQVGRRDNGECVFLRNDLCEIHAEFGFETKPSVCQLFPFFYVNTPQGKFFSVSFSCPAILESAGKPVQEHLPAVEETLKQSSTAFQEPMSSDTLIPLTSEFNVAWSDYLAIEKQLLDDLGVENPVKDLLLAAVKLLDQCQSSSPFNLQAEIDNEGILQEALALYAPTTVHVIAQLEGLDKGQEGFRGLALLEEQHDFRSTLLSGALPTFAVHRPLDEACREALSRYFKNLLIGKQLIHAGTLVTRLLLLASAVGVHLYYLDFQRRLAGSESNTFDELLWAFDLIEVHMVSHSEKFVPLFEGFERNLAGSI
jgi:Fe-S-cluster containining protein